MSKKTVLKKVKKNNKVISFQFVEEIKENPYKFQDYYSSISEICNDIPYEFRYKLRYLREKLGFTREQLEESSQISEQTIKQIELNENRRFSIETLIALCIGMKLPPELSFDILHVAGFNIENNCSRKNILYSFILRNFYNDGIENANTFLIENKEAPLTKI